MGKTIKVNLHQTKAEAVEIEKTKTLIITQKGRIDQVSSQVDIGAETATIRKLLTDIAEKLELEADSAEELGKALQTIVKYYTDAENKIVNYSFTKRNPDEDPSQPQITNPSDDVKEPEKTLDEKLQDLTGLSEEEIAAIKLILGFIPGLNCVVDIYEIINDYRKAMKDGNVSASEWAGIGLDILFLGLDAFSVYSFAKNMSKAVKEAKIANTAAKEASKAAEEAAEVAARRASKAAEAAEEAAGAAKKSYAKKQGAYLERKAEKAAAKATKASRKSIKAAEKAEKASNNIKKIIKDEVADNIKERYIGKKGGIIKRIPGNARETIKNALVEEDYSVQSPIDIL